MSQKTSVTSLSGLRCASSDALDLAQGGNGNAVQDVVAVVEEHLDHADQRGIQFVALEHLRQPGGRGVDDFLLQPARERDGVEVADRPDAEGGQRVVEAALALQIDGALLALEAVGRLFRRFGRGHAEFGDVVRRSPFMRGCQVILQDLRALVAGLGRRRRGRIPHFDRLVEGVALHRGAAGFADGFDHLGFGLQLRRFGAGHVEDVFLDDGAVQVVRAVAQRHLRQLQPQAHPIGGDVIEVVEVDAADGDGAQGVEARGRVLHRDVVVLRLIGQRDEADEPVRLILQGAQLAQVIHAVGERFDMAEEHRAGAAAAQAMPGAMDVEVFLGGFLAPGDGGADFLAEDLRAAAGEGIEAGVLQGAPACRRRTSSPARPGAGPRWR